MIKSNYRDLLKNLLKNLDFHKSKIEQNSENVTQKKHEILDFGAKNKAPADDWNNLVSFSKSAEPSTPSIDSKSQENGANSKGYSNFLKSFLSQPSSTLDISTALTVPAKAVISETPTVTDEPSEPTVAEKPAAKTTSSEPTTSTVAANPTVTTTLYEPEVTETTQIPSSEVGSIEYFAEILTKYNNTISRTQITKTISINKDSLENATYDDYGRLTSFRTSELVPTATNLNGLKTEYTNYEINYNDDGSYSMKSTNTHDARKTVGEVNTEVVLNFDINGVLKDITKTEVTDNIKTVTTYKADGKTVDSIKKYNKDGKEIKDTSQIPAGEIGSKEYLTDLIQQLIVKGMKYKADDYNVEVNKQGQVCKLIAKNPKIKAYWAEYNISYESDGKVTIEPKSLAEDNCDRIWTFKNGKKSQSEFTYKEPKDGIAKVVTTYNANGTETVKKFDADGNEIKDAEKPEVE